MGFQGFLDVSYAELVEKFGEPFVDYGSKVPYSWDININGVEGSVYGYYTTKQSKTWHIGGGESIMEALKPIFGDKVREVKYINL